MYTLLGTLYLNCLNLVRHINSGYTVNITHICNKCTKLPYYLTSVDYLPTK